MKKFIILTAALVLLSAPAFAALSGSSHDFSPTGSNYDANICRPCHTPHNGALISGAPLWNHTLTSSGAFTTYVGVDMEQVVGAPAGISLLCLSCHDGSVAVDSYPGGGNSNFITGTANLGTDLTNDHPISFDYSVSQGLDSELNAENAGGYVTDPLVKLYGTDLDMECATCHDVHNSAGNASMLVKSNAASALCIDCHNK